MYQKLACRKCFEKKLGLVPTFLFGLYAIPNLILYRYKNFSVVMVIVVVMFMLVAANTTLIPSKINILC